MALDARGAEIGRDDEQSFWARCGPLALVVTRQPPTAESMNAFREFLHELAADHPNAIYLLVALGARRPRLEEEVRQAIASLWRELGEAVNVAVWVRRGSFAGALQRSFITAVSMLRIRDTPTKVVTSPDGAFDWFLSLDVGLAEHAGTWRELVEQGLSG